MGNEVRDASVDEEAGVIDVGGDAAGGRAATSVIADPNGKCIPSRKEGGLKANGIQRTHTQTHTHKRVFVCVCPLFLKKINNC